MVVVVVVFVVVVIVVVLACCQHLRHVEFLGSLVAVVLYLLVVSEVGQMAA